MRRVRSVSNVIAVLGLIAVATIATIIGYSIIMNYLSQSFKPNYRISVTYAKLVFVTASENVDGNIYTTFKGEVGVSNPGNPTTLQICITAAYLSGTAVTPTTFTGSYSCPTVSVDSGYNVYSFLIRVLNSDLQRIGCGNNPQQCPILNHFNIVVKDGRGNVVDIVKPVYIVP